MKVPLSWLREYVEVTVEAERLAEALTLVGLAVEGIDTSGGDAVLDIDVTTNRVDCMNVYGVAREVAVIYGRPLRPLDLAFTEGGAPAAEALRVEIEADDLCPRFCARVLDVRLGPSPAFVRDRLEQVGVRPISNLVDLTNYVMMEMGQPTHAFDLGRIPEGRLNVRWARAGERLTTLDGVERTLDEKTGVVAGPERPLALAGIMGGASSEVSEDTKVVALEAAYWDAAATRRTAKALGMHTEASHRFERGADPEAPATATARLARLVEKIGAGRARPGLIEALRRPRPRRTVSLRLARVDAMLGTAVPHERTHSILTGLGFGVSSAPDGTLGTEVPSWRSDVSREADVIEEVARHYGSAQAPATIPPAHLPGGLRPAQVRERASARPARCGGTHRGHQPRLRGEHEERRVRGRAGVPPEPPVLRPRPASRPPAAGPRREPAHQPAAGPEGRGPLRDREGLCAAASGRRCLPREERRLAFLLCGTSRPRHWSEREGAVDFFAAKGLVELLAERLDAGDVTVSDSRDLPPFLHPGRAATIRDTSGVLGFAGSLHPDLRADSACGKRWWWPS